MSSADSIKVLIVNEEGHYLTGTATNWGFTDDRSRAKVFDYIRDHVADQIQLVRKAHGMVWVAVRLNPSEAYEFCDRCGSRMVSMKAYFDGTRFYCPQCREEALAEKLPPLETP